MNDVDISSLLAGIDDYETELIAAIKERLVQFLKDCAGDAAANHPYTDRSGDLTRSIDSLVEEIAPGLLKGILIATKIYANWIEHVSDGKYAFLIPAMERRRDEFRELFGADLVISDESIPAGGGART